MKKVWILQIDWTLRGESGHDIVEVFDEKTKAQDALREFVLNEQKTTWLNEFLEYDLTPKDDRELDEYDFSDDSFYAESYEEEGRTEVWITVFMVK